MVSSVSDEVLGAILPLVVYWLYSGLYVVLDPYLDRYRLHTKEEQSKNIATKLDVVKGALVEQTMQIFFFLLAFAFKGSYSGPVKQPPLPMAISQFVLAMFVLDAWLYFWHKLMHDNKFIYKHIHATHHRLTVTYPYGSQYNHPVEAFVNDTAGPVVAFLVSGMTPRTAIFFYILATIKGVEDHSGFYIPWNPFHRFFENNCAFHDVHHQLYGQKYNLGTPFFNIWDRLFGTYLPFEVKPRKGGHGYEVRPLKRE